MKQRNKRIFMFKIISVFFFFFLLWDKHVDSVGQIYFQFFVSEISCGMLAFVCLGPRGPSNHLVPLRLILKEHDDCLDWVCLVLDKD
jgi:hypothetical protein